MYSKAWAQATTNNTKLVLLTNDTSTAALAVVANKKIIFIHSFKNLGGTILEPVNRFIGFIGNGRVALAIVVDDSSLLAHVDIVTAPYASIISYLDKAEIQALAHPAVNTALIYYATASFLPAPWLLKVVSNTNTINPALIILAASKFAANSITSVRTTTNMSQAPITSSKNSSNGHGESKPKEFLG